MQLANHIQNIIAKVNTESDALRLEYSGTEAQLAISDLKIALLKAALAELESTKE